MDLVEAATLAGQRRAELLAELGEVERQLHGYMRGMRQAGATWHEICVASGYTSVNGVKKIVNPEIREAFNATDRRRRSKADDGRAMVSGVVLTTDATEAAIAASGFRGGR